MANTPNLYAEKIFAEHPIALWTLDNDIRYLSLIADTVRNMSSGWTFTDGGSTPSTASEFPYYKLNTYVNKITNSILSSGTTTFTATGTTTFSSNSDTFTVGFYYLKDTPYLNSMRIGYKIGAGATVWSSSITATTKLAEWTFASATFNATPSGANIVLEFTLNTPAAVTSTFYINGLTIGKWAEDYNLIDLGAADDTLPTTINLSGSPTVVSTSAYGTTSNTGYYMVNNKIAAARSTSFPLVFGSSNSTVLSYSGSDTIPSLIVPGQGVLIQEQKYKTRTLEMWLRIKAGTTVAKRIIGPIAGNDGIWIDGPNMILNIDGRQASYYIGEWDRPMLFQLVTTQSGAQVFINGDIAIDMKYDVDDITLENYYASTKVNDWIGIYCYSDIPRIEVDCIAIYGYPVDKILASKRYVYGQGVKYPSTTIESYGGKTVYPEFASANYSNNLGYGNSQKQSWTDGLLNNCIVESGALKAPNYVVPTVEIAASANKTVTQFLAAQTAGYIDMQPSTWTDEAHIFFDSFRPTINDAKAFYVVAQRVSNNTSAQTLFKILNKVTGDYLTAYVITESSVNKIKYDFYYQGATTNLAVQTGNTTSDKIIAGIAADTLIAGSTVGMSNFFANAKDLVVYVGGDGTLTGTSTFTGKIYKVGFSDSRNLRKISATFSSTTGLVAAASGVTTTMDAHVASYTLFLNTFDSVNFLDIAVNSYWQDYVPLSFFARYVDDGAGSTTYRADYLQFNIDVPRPIAFSTNEYDTSTSITRTYLSFQTIASGADTDILDIATSARVDVTNAFTSTNTTTKYEVVDGTVIYTPSVTVTDYAVVAHIESDIPSLILQPAVIRNMQFAGQGLSQNSSNTTQVGTKYGVSLSSLVPSFATKNPVLLPKSVDSYFYLSSNAGMQVAGTPSNTRGYSISLNPQAANTFDIGMMQIVAKFQIKEFTSNQLLFEFVNLSDSPDTKIGIYASDFNSAKTRASLVAKNQSGTTYTNLDFYINGVKTVNPMITLDEWVTIGVKLTTVVDLNSEIGQINICGPMLVNNFTYTQLFDATQATINYYNYWINVLYPSTSAVTWNNITGGFWSAIVTSTGTAPIRGFSADDAYKLFTGTAVSITGGDTSEQYVRTNKYKYSTYLDILSSKTDALPA